MGQADNSRGHGDRVKRTETSCLETLLILDAHGVVVARRSLSPDLTKPARHVHPLRGQKERMVICGYIGFSCAQGPKTAKYFVNLVLAEAPAPEFRKNTVVPDDSIFRTLSRVPRGKPHNVTIQPGQKDARAHCLGIVEYFLIVLLPIGAL